MVESGDWMIPWFEGVPRLQKPPLVYWLTAASMRVLGKNEFAARLPTALAVASVVLATGALGSRVYGVSRGLAAAILVASSAGLPLLGKLIMPEPFLALGTVAIFLCVVRAVEDPGRAWRWALAAWAAAAFATLAKGPAVLVVAAGALAIVATVSPKARRPLACLARPGGIALFLVLVLPWPLYVEARFPGFLRDSFLNEQLGHVLDTHYPRDSRPTPLLLFWVEHAAWWFPWILFAPAALLARRARDAHPFASLPTAWLAAVVVSMSLVAQRQYYTMSAWPAFALLVGNRVR